jgi:phage baseplate assembly protein W
MMPNKARQKDVSVPHFMLPFQFGGINGGAFMNEQDSPEDITDCIKTIIAFPIGSLISQPDFGLPDILFEEYTSGRLPEEVKGAIMEWEDRASITIEEGGSPFDDQFILNLILKVGTDNA